MLSPAGTRSDRPSLATTLFRQLKHDPQYRNLAYAVAHTYLTRPNQTSILRFFEERGKPNAPREPLPGPPLSIIAYPEGPTNVYGHYNPTVGTPWQPITINTTYATSPEGWKRTLAHEFVHLLNNYRGTVPFPQLTLPSVLDLYENPSLGVSFFKDTQMNKALADYLSKPPNPAAMGPYSSVTSFEYHRRVNQFYAFSEISFDATE